MKKDIKQKYEISSLLELPIGETFISASDYDKCGCIYKKVNQKDHWSHFQVLEICKGCAKDYKYEQDPYSGTYVLAHDYPVIKL